MDILNVYQRFHISAVFKYPTLRHGVWKLCRLQMGNSARPWFYGIHKKWCSSVAYYWILYYGHKCETCLILAKKIIIFCSWLELYTYEIIFLFSALSGRETSTSIFSLLHSYTIHHYKWFPLRSRHAKFVSSFVCMSWPRRELEPHNTCQQFSCCQQYWYG